jgi:hypothetical protein
MTYRGCRAIYDEQALATLVLYIGMVNVYNRLNVTTKQVPGAEKW